MSDILLSRQEKVEKIVFNFEPENTPYESGPRDPESSALTMRPRRATPDQSKGVAKANREGTYTC